MDTAIVAAVQANIAVDLPLTRSLLIVKNDRLIFERYYGDASYDQPYKIASVTKTITALLLGIAMADGKIKGTDATVAALFPEESRDLPSYRTRQITLEHLLTMRSGLQWDRWGDDFKRLMASRNRFHGALRLKQLHPPGTVFKYNSALSHLIGGAVARASDDNLLDFANARLFGPMEESAQSWRRDPRGYYVGGWGLQLTSRQLAKLGVLLLHNGTWYGREVVPADWIEKMTTPHVRFGNGKGYGYHIWTRTMSGCAAALAIGRGGQFIVTVPAHRLIIVITATIEPQNRGAAGKYNASIGRLVAAAGAPCTTTAK